MMELVAAVQKFTAEEEDERTQAALKLMSYLQEHKRRHLYFKYVHFLTDTHVTL
jgi:hypothetical protein